MSFSDHMTGKINDAYNILGIIRCNFREAVAVPTTAIPTTAVPTIAIPTTGQWA